MSQYAEDSSSKNRELAPKQESITRFILHPFNTQSSQISGHLIRSSLSDHPVYEAVSYNHDPSTLSEDLSLDDALYHEHFLAQEAYVSILLEGKDFDVPETIYNALLALRHQDKERALWVDVICLTEEEKEDKVTKTTIIPSVFEEAERVLVWLGNETSNSKEGMDLLNLCGRYRNSFSAFKGVLPLSFITKKHVDGLVSLLNDPYFNQLWIIQELILAPSILLVVGSESAQWYGLYHATTTLCSQATRSYPQLSAVLTCQAGYLWRNWRDREGDGSRRNTLSSWICLGEGFTGWEDKRERVFAVLAVSRDGQGIEVDYKKSKHNIATEVVRLYEGSGDSKRIEREVESALGIGSRGVLNR